MYECKGEGGGGGTFKEFVSGSSVSASRAALVQQRRVEKMKKEKQHVQR